MPLSIYALSLPQPVLKVHPELVSHQAIDELSGSIDSIVVGRFSTLAIWGDIESERCDSMSNCARPAETSPVVYFVVSEMFSIVSPLL